MRHTSGETGDRARVTALFPLTSLSRLHPHVIVIMHVITTRSNRSRLAAAALQHIRRDREAKPHTIRSQPTQPRRPFLQQRVYHTPPALVPSNTLHSLHTRVILPSNSWYRMSCLHLCIEQLASRWHWTAPGTDTTARLIGVADVRMSPQRSPEDTGVFVVIFAVLHWLGSVPFTRIGRLR